MTNFFDVADHLKDRGSIVAYLNVPLSENDQALFLAVLGDVVKAKGAVEIAKAAGLSLKSLFKVLSPFGNPEFSTILSIINALGLHLHVTLEKMESIDLSVNKNMDEILINRLSSLRAQIATFAIRKQAHLDGLDKMTDDQVNEIIEKTRLDRKKKRGHSPLDVPGVKTDITRQEILDSIHEGHEQDMNETRESYKPKISSVKPLKNEQLLIKFTNGIEKIFDCTKLFHIEKFIQLKNPSFFNTVRVDVGGYGISWSDDLDLSEDELWENGVEVIDHE